MEKMTMGMFIAALRKEKGMTQQQVADRLGVSNKAVSRWERDESAPDIILLPALAELLSVTCDELLRGERNGKPMACEETKPFAAQQINRLARRTLSDFKTMTYISLALSAVGLVCMFGVSYGFYRPVIGFAVLLLFVLAAVLLEVIAVMRLRDRKANSELLACAAPSVLKAFDTTLGGWSFAAFFAALAVVLLSLPLVLFTSSYVNSVLSVGTYFVVFFIGIVLLLAVLWLRLRTPFVTRITGQPYKISRRIGHSTRRRMTAWQLGAVGLAGVLFFIAPWFDWEPYGSSVVMFVLNYTGLALLAADIVIFIVAMCRAGNDRRHLILPGVRNILMIPSGFLISMVHSTGYMSYTDETGMGHGERYEYWTPEYAVAAVVVAVVVYALFTLIEHVWLCKSHQ